MLTNFRKLNKWKVFIFSYHSLGNKMRQVNSKSKSGNLNTDSEELFYSKLQLISINVLKDKCKEINIILAYSPIPIDTTVLERLC